MRLVFPQGAIAVRAVKCLRGICGATYQRYRRNLESLYRYLFMLLHSIACLVFKSS